MSIHVTKTTIERVDYTRAEVIERLVESEDYAPGDPTPDEARAAWGELPDVELAYHLAMRLNDGGISGDEPVETVTADIGEKGSDVQQWTVDGWTGDEPTAMLREAMGKPASQEAQ